MFRRRPCPEIARRNRSWLGVTSLLQLPRVLCHGPWPDVTADCTCAGAVRRSARRSTVLHRRALCHYSGERCDVSGTGRAVSRMQRTCERLSCGRSVVALEEARKQQWRAAVAIVLAQPQIAT